MLWKDLSARIMKQELQLSSETDVQNIKRKIRSQKQQKQAKLQNIRPYLTEEQIRLNNLNQEHGSSSWLTTLPLSEEGYDLTKQLFWDLIWIRYGWTLTRLLVYCECGEKFNLLHALSCKKGDFVSLRHNWKPLTIIRKSSILDVAAVLDPPQVSPQIYIMLATNSRNLLRKLLSFFT